MPKPSPRLRVLKWIGTAMSLLISAAIALSAFASVGYATSAPTRPGDWSILLDLVRGEVAAIAETRVGPVPTAPVMTASSPRGFHFSSATKDTRPWVWWCPWPPYREVFLPDNIFRTTNAPGVRLRTLTIPLWQPLTLVLILTAYLWYRDRRPPAGHCQECGYDLTANESGHCPECGNPV